MTDCVTHEHQSDDLSGVFGARGAKWGTRWGEVGNPVGHGGEPSGTRWGTRRDRVRNPAGQGGKPGGTGRESALGRGGDQRGSPWGTVGIAAGYQPEWPLGGRDRRRATVGITAKHSGNPRGARQESAWSAVGIRVGAVGSPPGTGGRAGRSGSPPGGQDRHGPVRIATGQGWGYGRKELGQQNWGRTLSGAAPVRPIACGVSAPDRSAGCTGPACGTRIYACPRTCRTRGPSTRRWPTSVPASYCPRRSAEGRHRT